MIHWQPTATIDTLQQRAAALKDIRLFFSERGVLEVDVPVLGQAAVTDLHIDCIMAEVSGQRRYLQSSPEFFMKRLLAAGSGPIYYLGKAFRNDESGRRHNPEFTMLEWYRQGWNEQQLMAELALLVETVAGQPLTVAMRTYREVFVEQTTLDPHRTQTSELQRLAAEVSGRDFSDSSRSECLDLVFSLVVGPSLPSGLVCIEGYPACQSALARLAKDAAGELVARRFEVFLNGVELANGYCELTDPLEQQSRFQADVALRRAAGKARIEPDKKLLAALQAGLPDCVGVALGVDRLLMQLLGQNDIGKVMAFID